MSAYFLERDGKEFFLTDTPGSDDVPEESITFLGSGILIDSLLFATWNWVGSRSKGSHENVAASVAIHRRKRRMMKVSPNKVITST